ENLVGVGGGREVGLDDDVARAVDMQVADIPEHTAARGGRYRTARVGEFGDLPSGAIPDVAVRQGMDDHGLRRVARDLGRVPRDVAEEGDVATVVVPGSEGKVKGAASRRRIPWADDAGNVPGPVRLEDPLP